jgi:hypothetical protein
LKFSPQGFCNKQGKKNSKSLPNWRWLQKNFWGLCYCFQNSFHGIGFQKEKPMPAVNYKYEKRKKEMDKKKKKAEKERQKEIKKNTNKPKETTPPPPAAPEQ